ncbi:LemA family protein, partial [Candidatus Parvarchaeota archaeon]|nr:LemA family protein [Candidatus Parvarchaeota archaeon]
DTGKVLVLPFFSENSSFLGSLFSGLLKGSMSKDLVGLDKKYSGSPKKFGFLGALLNKPSTDQNLAPFLAQHCPSLSNYADKVEIEEKFIEEGDSIFLIGQAQEVEKEGRVQMMICKGKDKGAFCIADGTEKSALSSISFWTYVVLAFSPIAFAASFALLLFRFRVLDFGTEIFAAFVVACMYLYVFVVMLMEYYNSMFILKNGVEKASANVDALVKRRADLIPNLVEAIKAYSKYEKGIMNDIAAIRQGSADQAKQLFVLAENYPKLKASDNYKALSWELAHTENWIAGARTYVSESIALYNTRIGSFPYLLFAPFFGLRPIDCGKSTE